ncbi:hypothetical protein QBC34DRAFT_219350 [Podospora aff. communis PSN243]|uniref:Secreted protein n=1 Tax=Podospora aff. communis PSN243 TaxID=3040156 RepID=A0AAV9H2T6_9PEZI|nr:hypothetical protein QBC34DRAFT_219350 [Podospora aff. communis PSN243]
MVFMRSGWLRLVCSRTCVCASSGQRGSGGLGRVGRAWWLAEGIQGPFSIAWAVEWGSTNRQVPPAPAIESAGRLWATADPLLLSATTKRLLHSHKPSLTRPSVCLAGTACRSIISSETFLVVNNPFF